MQRVKVKLEAWISYCLSRAGRLTLAKSVLSNMGAFHMQMQKLSTKMHKELDSAVRQCIWGSTAGRRIHLLSWETLRKPKEESGDGLRRASDMNKSLLAKLGWHILTCGERHGAECYGTSMGYQTRSQSSSSTNSGCLMCGRELFVALTYCKWDCDVRSLTEDELCSGSTIRWKNGH